jgi:hypothetical protein
MYALWIISTVRPPLATAGSRRAAPTSLGGREDAIATLLNKFD